jgi:hypothetical protein
MLVSLLLARGGFGEICAIGKLSIAIYSLAGEGFE